MTIPQLLLLSTVLASFTLAPQAGMNRLTDGEIREVGELVSLADRAAKGESLDGGELFRFHAHFLRAPDGRTYVPFSLGLDDVSDGAFSTVAIYIRVARRGDRTTSADRNRPIGPTGVAVPVFAFDAAAAASAALRLLDRPDRPTPDAFPFEAAHFTPLWRAGGMATVRRALVVPPGAYDLYIVIREREHSVAPNRTPRAAVIKTALDVPDFATKRLSMSSPLLAERVEPIAQPLDPRDQIARPYALGTAEIVPAGTAAFRQSDTPSIVFFVYNAASDADGRPDVDVEYRFFRIFEGHERLVGLRLPARFNADSLPAAFDLRAGHQIVAVQPLPLASLLAGDYRLEITATDRLAARNTSGAITFTIVP